MKDLFIKIEDRLIGLCFISSVQFTASARELIIFYREGPTAMRLVVRGALAVELWDRLGQLALQPETK